MRGARCDAAKRPLVHLILSRGHVDHRDAPPNSGDHESRAIRAKWRTRKATGAGTTWIGDSSRTAVREQLPRLHDAGDGGPVEISETLEDGADIADFRVVHLPRGMRLR